MVDLEEEDGIIFDDDQVEDEGDGQSFSMEMTRTEKMEAQKPWRLGIFIKQVGRTIGYQVANHGVAQVITSMTKSNGSVDAIEGRISTEEETDNLLSNKKVKTCIGSSGQGVLHEGSIYERVEKNGKSHCSKTQS